MIEEVTRDSVRIVRHTDILTLYITANKVQRAKETWSSALDLRPFDKNSKVIIFI